MSASERNPNPWKTKALALAGELDEQQARWERNEKRLVRALIRLALAVEGYDSELDAHLLQLRAILRKGILTQERLEEVDRLTDGIVRREGKGAVVPEWQKPFLDFLMKYAPGQSERDHLKRLAEKPLADPKALHEELQRVFGVSKKGEGAWSKLQHWLGLGKTRESPEGALLRNHLLHWVKEIEIPTGLSDQAERLLHLLEQGVEIDEALQETARLMDALKNHLRQEREEIEAFLAQLTDKLQELESQTRDVGDLFQPLDPGWNEKLSAQVVSLRQQTLEETDLRTLKSVVTDKLDAITVQLKAFRQAEEKRIQEAERKVEAMGMRLKELEQESEDLRQRLRVANQQALFDALTGLPNRQAVDERLQQEFARWRRFGNPCSLLVWDIDHFKQINDRFGHRAGDKALRIVGRTLREGIRKVDFVGRYGGEEFLMLLPGTDQDGALKLAEKLREAVKHCGFNSRGIPVPITISCGISCIREEDTPHSLFERADQALYQAKRGGRDRCVMG